MGYLHVEIAQRQSAKHPPSPCGDVLEYRRCVHHTTLVVCDGLGHGVRAHVSASMCAARIMESLDRGMSLRETFHTVANDMNSCRGEGHPYTAFTLARIRSDGEATALSYEAPGVILVTPQVATTVSQRSETLPGGAVMTEAVGTLSEGDGLLLMSDGITQAGLGRGLAWGLTEQGVCRFLKPILTRRPTPDDIVKAVHNHARQLWGSVRGDDCSVLMGYLRPGKVVNVLTGPPVNKEHDLRVVDAFLAADGESVVCGGSTGDMVARVMKQDMLVLNDTGSAYMPPQYFIDDIDLVTEGVVTLNQVCNVIDCPEANIDRKSGVGSMVEMLQGADRVNFTVGMAPKKGVENLPMQQMGLMGRQQVVARIAEKLRAMGKLVVVTPAV